jgi:hypothetical protein
MITIRAAKSKLENQEGMNHLWVRLQPIGPVKNARMQIILPPGIFRSRNLNNFYETDAGELVIYQPEISDDLYIEIYTREPVKPESKTIIFALSYICAHGVFNKVEHSFPIHVVEEDEMNDVGIDAEVVRRIKELRLYAEGTKDRYLNEYPPAKILKIDSGQYSDLEKKYRIEG